ncbi:conjugal transfer protein TraH [Salinisphaera sp. P385]|uniref:Conjugal transfer protein TraH n=1 Tax=Spectribacter acetivorans TaxID=3075603 RepID=A0ABU3B7W2_9GAMM|nr:conjugal transfer protein TraH [Salinisphaera sp. P385]MDT0618559.1 conjugal transfer protein TraH [Salinisphaera sp. P385]
MSPNRIAIAAVFLSLLLVTTSPARASLQQEMDDMFGAMVNTTAPGAYEGSRRGVLTGGGVEVRNKLRAPALFNLQAPEFNAGCGGISLFGGAFSFINLDEFTEYLRSIMSNAVGYFFQLGIDAVCPTCAEIMRNLERRIGQLAQEARNSCQMAKWLVDDVTGIGPAMKSSMEGNAFEEAAASANSWLEREIESNAKGTDPVTEAADDNPALAEKYWNANLVYVAMRDAQVADEFIAGLDEDGRRAFLEQLQSITGTVVTKLVDNGGQKTLEINPIGHGITLSHLLDGNREAGEGDDNPEILSCPPAGDDPDNKCTEVVRIAADPDFQGLRDRVGHIMFGGPAQYGMPATPGILLAIEQDTVGFDAISEALIGATELPIVPILTQTAPYPGAANNFARQMVDIISLEMVNRLLSEVLGAVDEAVTAKAIETDNVKFSILLDRIRTVREELRQQSIRMKEEEDQFVALLQAHSVVQESTRGQNFSVPDLSFTE